ncbi:Catechol-2,3-dioxygenase [Actinomadura madurae]|uniref:Catechol-2,3-dioxygenase n=1 Tax=Actinomadura madurae TaxID=1993 RepID=A0A1I5RII8_9ACTN|nr:VOC family protein [Actinomadura madurae]SFP57756.1 Catechol-2,3-dioxygenase [Actinomadura madurae]
MISALHHYALTVPDLEVADGFLQDFGLETAEKDGSLIARCRGRAQEQVRMVEAPAKRLHHVSFTLRPGGLDAAREALERGGAPVLDPPPGAPESGLWTRDPDGNAVQLLDEPPAPARAVAEVLTNIGEGHRRIGVAQWRRATEDVMPRRLGHALLFTAQPERMTAFYTGALGLRVSDTIHGGAVTFLSAGRGDHHIFGFIRSTHRGFHHASFEVPSIDAIALGADRMRARGRDAGWGLGRHTIGSNFFHYTLDPWGSWIEWFSDIDQVDDGWVARDWDVPPHLWGAPPPETFLENREPRA